MVTVSSAKNRRIVTMDTEKSSPSTPKNRHHRHRKIDTIDSVLGAVPHGPRRPTSSTSDFFPLEKIFFFSTYFSETGWDGWRRRVESFEEATDVHALCSTAPVLQSASS